MSHLATIAAWRTRLGLSPIQRLVLLALADEADSTGYVDGRARRSQSFLADKTGCGRRTVQRALEALEAAGAITTLVAGTGSERAEYLLLVMGDGDSHAASNPSPGGATVAPGGRQPGAGGSATLAPLPPSAPITNPGLPGVGPDSPVAPSPAGGRAEVVAAIFEAWRAATGRNSRTVLTPERRRAVERALAQYPPDVVHAAARGIALSAWHNGDNPDGKTWTELTLALRDGAQIERFADLAARGEPERRGARRSSRDRQMDHLPDVVADVWEALGLDPDADPALGTLEPPPRFTPPSLGTAATVPATTDPNPEEPVDPR